jgi:hypothetical protein
LKAKLLILCALAAAPGLAATPVWTNIGPEGGEARSFASDPRTDTAFVLNSRSGVSRSTAGGRWTLVFDAIAMRVTPTRVAVDPQTSRVYVGTTTGLFRSDDQGTTWRSMIEESIIDVTAVGDHVIISTPKNVLRSGNAGVTWTAIPSPSDAEAVSVVRIDPRSFDRVIAVVEGNLFRSDDSGNSWNQLLVKNIVAVTFGDSIYAAGSDGVFDCGTDCTRFGTDPSIGVAHWRGIVYVAITDGVLRFTNRWERVIDGFPAATVRALNATPSALLAGTTAGVFRTDDGTRWSSNNEGLTNVRITAVAAASGIVVAATQGQSFMRRSGGTWTTADAGLPPGQPIARKLATDGSTFYAAFLGSGLSRSTNQGLTWDDVSAALRTRDAFDVAAESGAVVAATLAGLLRSNDRGTTWRALTTFPAPWSGAVAVRGATIVASFTGTAFVSSDGGASWMATEFPVPIRQLALAGDRAYASTDRGIFVRTGVAWTTPVFALVGGSSRINAMTASSTRLYVSVTATEGSSGIYFTDDGVSWSLVPGSEGLPPDITTLAVDEVFLYAGTNGGSIFATLLIPPRGRSVRH